MMRGVDHWSLAVRRPDMTIGLHDWPLVSWMKRYPILKIPIVRGVVALVESLVIGVRALTLSANESLGEEEQQLGKKEIGLTLVIAFAFAAALFFLAPLFVTGLFRHWLGTSYLFWLVEGVVRVAIFIGYLLIITRIRDLRRVFEYHGAEHMSIHALEHGQELTVSNVEKFGTLHLRCGTSFLLIVMVVAIFVFAIVKWPAWYWLILSRDHPHPAHRRCELRDHPLRGAPREQPGGAPHHVAGPGPAVDDHQAAGRGADRGGDRRPREDHRAGTSGPSAREGRGGHGLRSSGGRAQLPRFVSSPPPLRHPPTPRWPRPPRL